MNMRFLLVISCLLLPVASCSALEESSKTVKVEVGDRSIASALVEQLAAEDIWYKSIGGDTIEVTEEDAEKVILLLNNISGSILPQGRSASFPRKMLAALVQELDAHNVSYSVVDFDNSKWLVWEQEDTEIVERLIEDVSKEQNIKELSEEDF